MSLIDGLRHRVRVWMRGDEYERELAEEVRFHLDLDASQQSGPSPREAALAARRRFGNPTFLTEERRRMAGLDRLDGVARDVKHLARSLRHSPGFALVAVLTLALGIATTTAFVSLADHILVRGLPFRDADRLMMLLERDTFGVFRTPSAPTAGDWQADSGVARAFEAVTYIRGEGVPLRVDDDSENVGAAFVSAEFFPLMQVRPALGRVLGADDYRADAPRVAVISHRLWVRRFGADSTLVGRAIDVDSAPAIVIGVLPVGAVYPSFADVWMSISFLRHKQILQQRGFHADSRTIGRLRAGVDSTRAVAYMHPVATRLGAEYPAEQAGWGPAMRAVRLEFIGNVGPMLWTLAGAGAAILLLACANVAGLLLARVSTRGRELAVRSALGASRGRIVRQLLTETLLLAAVGGVIGTAIAISGIDFARKFLETRVLRVEELSVDLRVLLIAAAATLVTALLCGLWPALRATRNGTAAVLRASVATAGARTESRARRGLVALQFALAVVLLVGAGLLFQSLRRAAAVESGFDASGVLTMRLSPPPDVYGKPEQAAALYTRLMSEMRAIPGVVESAFINHMAFGRAGMITRISIEGRTSLDSSNQVLYRTVSDTYLRTMGMSVVAGRWFGEDDMRSPGGSFVVNETMARRYWPGMSAVGQRITATRASQARADFGQPLPGTVVGVVADLRLHDGIPNPEIYVPYTVETWPWGMLVVRSRDGRRSIPSIERAIRSVDPRLMKKDRAGAGEIGVLEEDIVGQLRPRRTLVSLIGSFAFCAMVLAAIGMYGVVAQGIVQRTREIGVRKALGATDGNIVTLMLRESSRVVAIGVVVGCAAAFGGARLISQLLFQTGAADPSTYLVTVGVLGAAAFLATYLPARRAVRLDPTIAMRGE